jgi:hypothetical protein
MLRELLTTAAATDPIYLVGDQNLGGVTQGR